MLVKVKFINSENGRYFELIEPLKKEDGSYVILVNRGGKKQRREFEPFFYKDKETAEKEFARKIKRREQNGYKRVSL